jgi:hypothetical protein
MMDARKKAQEYIQDFGESVQESKNNPEDKLSLVWQYGLFVAQEWLRLIDAQSISEDEFQRFIGSVHANRYMSSAWDGMARDIYAWATQKGFSLPEEHEFFASSSYFVNDYLRTLLSPQFPEKKEYLEIANKLFAYFKANYLEDSRNSFWQTGYEITKDWTGLIQSETPDPLSINKLIDRIYSLEYRTVYLEYFVMSVGLCRWMIEMGLERYVQNEHAQAFMKQFVSNR